MCEKKCSSCGATIDLNSTECKYCGESIIVEVQYHPQQAQKYQAPLYQQSRIYTPSSIHDISKSKTTAGILAIIFGGLGVHKFYLGKIKTGIFYLIFCWTYIPEVIGIIEGITYLTSSDENFYDKYVNK
ncbi:TM2 domain-containing protein [Clostridium algoriphilum]|nr:TM2 domain-containing protein [Clostridium algoriphilum]